MLLGVNLCFANSGKQGDDHMVIRTFISIDGHLCRQIDYKGRIVLLDALNRYQLRDLTREWLAEVRA